MSRKIKNGKLVPVHYRWECSKCSSYEWGTNEEDVYRAQIIHNVASDGILNGIDLFKYENYLQGMVAMKEAWFRKYSSKLNHTRCGGRYQIVEFYEDDE